MSHLFHKNLDDLSLSDIQALKQFLPLGVDPTLDALCKARLQPPSKVQIIPWPAPPPKPKLEKYAMAMNWVPGLWRLQLYGIPRYSPAQLPPVMMELLALQDVAEETLPSFGNPKHSLGEVFVLDQDLGTAIEIAESYGYPILE